MRQRMLGTRRRGIQRERDLSAYAGEPGLQVPDGTRLPLPRRQCRVGKTPHRRHLRLIWGEQPIRVLAGSQMNAIAHVQQRLDLVVIPAVRSVGQP